MSLLSDGEMIASLLRQAFGHPMRTVARHLFNHFDRRVRHDLVDQATDVLGLAAAVQLRCWRRFATSMLSNTDLETK
jgi:DNA repair protein RadC